MAACVSASLVHSATAYFQPTLWVLSLVMANLQCYPSLGNVSNTKRYKLPHLNHSVFHEWLPFLGFSLIQYKDTFEFGKQWISCVSNSDTRAFATLVMSFAKRRVDKSSSLGMVCLVVGETLVLDATKVIVIPSSFSIFKYTTAA